MHASGNIATRSQYQFCKTTARRKPNGDKYLKPPVKIRASKHAAHCIREPQSLPYSESCCLVAFLYFIPRHGAIDDYAMRLEPTLTTRIAVAETPLQIKFLRISRVSARARTKGKYLLTQYTGWIFFVKHVRFRVSCASFRHIDAYLILLCVLHLIL